MSLVNSRDESPLVDVVLSLAEKNSALKSESREADRKRRETIDFFDLCIEKSNRTFSVDHFLRTTFPYVLKMMGADLGSMSLKSENLPFENPSYYVVAQQGIEENAIFKQLLNPSDAPFMHQAIGSLEPTSIDRNGKSSLLVPINYHNSNHGLICVSRNGSNKFDNSKDRSFLNDISRILGGLTSHIAGRKYALQQDLKFVGLKDKYTEGHSYRVACYSKELAKGYGYEVYFQEIIFLAGLLHDIGKVGIDPDILKKEAELDECELKQMKEHPEIGSRILRDRIGLRLDDEESVVVEGADQHHEKYIGSGYPNQLRETEISMPARMIGLADAFDAMSIPRCYRKTPLTETEIYKEIQVNKGKHFDPKISDLFMKIVPGMAWFDKQTETYHTPFCDIFAKLPFDRSVLSDVYTLSKLGKNQCGYCHNGNRNLIEVKSTIMLPNKP